MTPTPSVLLYAEDVFVGTKRTIGVAASRPPLLEPIRRADPAEGVWLIAVDPASVAHAHEIELPPGASNLDACPSVALVADGRGGIASIAPAISVARGDVPPQQACLARSRRSHTQIGHLIAAPPDLLDATLTFTVNGQVRLSSSLSSLVVTPYQLIESITRLVALRAGDIVLLGSPPGTAGDTGTGWLAAGDRLEAVLDVRSQVARLSATASTTAHEAAAHAPLPSRVIGTGTNYFSHVEEMGSSPPAVPTANFFKLTGAVCTSGTPIVIPQGSFVDYEGEIAVVIGEPLSDVSADEVGEADISLCLANDVTAREVPTTHLSLAKSAAGFCPLGPARVPIRELRPSEIEFVVEVNGEPRQQGRADDMIFSIPELVASLSRAIDLRPGDVILTGSPAGVGAALTPQRFLDAGDVVRVTSPQLGVLENRFVAAAPSRMNS